MSYVTNVMVHGRLPNRHDDLAMRSAMHLESLTPCPADGYEAVWGGGKMPECDIWAGAFNYLDEGEFLQRLESHPWLLDVVEVFILSPVDDYFRIYRLAQGQFRERHDGE